MVSGHPGWPGSFCSLHATRPRRALQHGPAVLAARMTGSRAGRIWGLVAAQAGRRGGRVSAADACAAAVAAVSVTGGWLTAASDGEAGHLMRVTDAVGEQLAELQLTLGEGPSLDAPASGGPVLASDLGTAEAGRRWPAFAPAARQARAGAIFVFPLRIGAIGVGVLGLYRAWPARSAHSSWVTRWSSPTPRPCCCSTARKTRRGTPRREPAQAGSLRISHCTGPRSTRPPGCSPSSLEPASRAPSCDCAYAFVNDLRLNDVARDIVARRLRLYPDPSQDGGA
jgi:hypothetical protein